MHKNISYHIQAIGLRVGLGVLLTAGLACAQDRAPTAPTEADLYCSGMVTTKPVPTDTYLISGENSRYKQVFATDEYVYINQGADHGVKVADQFDVIRPVHDTTGVIWFKYQTMLTKAMGTTYADIGRLRVVKVNAKTSTALMSLPCGFMQRGDLVRPFAVRTSPQYHNVKFDPLSEPSGKKTAMVVSTKGFGTLIGAGSIVYVNLGSDQGVKMGDYFRVYRFQGTHIDTLYQISNTAYKVEGFGGTPVPYGWDNLPRQVLGEGVVLRTGPNSSTVFLTDSRMEIFVGDYVDLE